MMRTNQIIDCCQPDDDVSVLSTPSFGGDDDNREERQKSHFNDNRRNSEYTNHVNNNRTSSCRIFKPSVVGRAEMLTTREECDPTTTNQQRHLASELKRQRLRRSRIQLQQQQQQHANSSPRLETISTNIIEKNNSSIMKKVDRHSREAVQRCRRCQLPIISVGNDSVHGSKVPHCTCLSSPPIMPRRNSSFRTNAPLNNTKKLSSSSPSELITPQDPYITKTNNSPKEKKQPQLQQQKVSSSLIHSPGGLEYLTRTPSIIPSNCSLQYSSNDDKEEEEEEEDEDEEEDNEDEEEEDLLVDPPALVRKISVEREFSPKEEKIEMINFPLTNDDRSNDVISLPTFVSSDNDEPSNSMHETCSKQSNDNLQDDANTTPTISHNDNDGKNELRLNPVPRQSSTDSALIVKPDILKGSEKDFFSHAPSPSTTVTNKHSLDESSNDDKEDVTYYPSFVISPSKKIIDSSVHGRDDFTPKNSDCGETIRSLDTTHPTSATTCSEDLLNPDNETLSQCSRSSSQEFGNFRDANKKKWWKRKSNNKLNTSGCSSPSSSTASTVKANWKRWKSKGKATTSSLKSNRVDRRSPKKDDEYGLLDKEQEKQEENDPARQDEKLEFDDSCLDYFTDDKSLDGIDLHDKKIPIQEFLQQQCKNHPKNRALVVSQIMSNVIVH